MKSNQITVQSTSDKKTVVESIHTPQKPIVVIPVKTSEPVKKELSETPAIRNLSIDELTERAERLHLLKMKYDEIKEKRKQLQAFSITHDEKNAQLTIVDAKGDKITTNSPLSISKVIAIWSEELDSHLFRNETEMRAILEIA